MEMDNIQKHEIKKKLIELKTFHINILNPINNKLKLVPLSIPSVSLEKTFKVNYSTECAILIDLAAEGFYESFTQIYKLLEQDELMGILNMKAYLPYNSLRQNTMKLELLRDAFKSSEILRREGHLEESIKNLSILSSSFKYFGDLWIEKYILNTALILCGNEDYNKAAIRANLFYRLALHYLTLHEYKHAISFFEYVYDLTKSTNWIDYEEGKFLKRLASCQIANLYANSEVFIVKTLPVNLITYYEKALNATEEYNEFKLKTKLLFKLGHIYMNEKNLEMAKYYFQRIINITHNSMSLIRCQAQLGYAECLCRHGNFLEGMNIASYVLIIGKERKKQRIQFEANRLISLIKESQLDHEESYKIAQEMNNIASEEKESVEASAIAGIAKAHELYTKYTDLIKDQSQNSITALLDWKCSGTPFLFSMPTVVQVSNGSVQIFVN